MRLHEIYAKEQKTDAVAVEKNNMLDRLQIPIIGKASNVKLLVYPQSSKAKVFKEDKPYAGESRYQLVEGCTYTYEFVGESSSHRCQFERENEIVQFHRNTTSHACEGTLTTGIYVGHLTLNVVNVDTKALVDQLVRDLEEKRNNSKLKW